MKATVPNHIRFGRTLLGLDHYAEAAEQFSTALRLDPDSVKARVGLLVALERSNHLDEANEVLSYWGSAGIPIELSRANLIAAKIDRRQGRTSEALARLTRMESSPLRPQIAAQVHHELGFLHDGLGAVESAMDHFEKGNRLAAQMYPDLFKERHNYKNLLREEIIFEEGPETPSADPARIFLLGFARSGTTLLHQILTRHPRIQVLDELPAIETLTSLDGQISHLRERYFGEIERHVIAGQGDVIIDKHPFHARHLPLIQRLFPGARVIFAHRHPCDVCLSCFMQDFGFNSMTINFTTLEDTVDTYVSLMRHWERVRSRLRFPCHVIKLENLISNFETEVSSLLRYIGVEWDPTVIDFQTGARKNNVPTPSYSQVVRPLNADGVGRWLKYRRWLDPFYSELEPFI